MGEILDRTFSLYRRYFLLFLGISAIPKIPVVAMTVFSTLYFARGPVRPRPGIFTGHNVGAILVYYLLFLIVGILSYLFSQGGTILAVSELYLGRATSMGKSFRTVWDEIGPLFGVVFLSGLAIAGATLLLIIPGIYVACRLLVCVAAALIEKRGATDSLSRSFNLTQDNAGRAFVIGLLYFVIALALESLLSFPFTIAAAVSMKSPALVPVWLALSQLAGSIANILVSPLLLIATAIFYFDLRVRKEGFDLQFMLDPTSERRGGPGSLPSILP